MDRLATRYADPIFLLDGYISTGRFCWFLKQFADRKREDDRWEFFLHKVWDKSYREFCKELDTTEANASMSRWDIEATINQTQSILGAFTPPQEPEEGGV